MKLIESSSGLLTNYEVYQHLMQQRVDYEAGQKKRRGPGNYETVAKEIIDYLTTAPSPLSATPIPYTDGTVRKLMAALREFELTKAELIMIMNLRPTHTVALNVILEEMEERFPNSSIQDEILRRIVEVLGTPDGEQMRKAMMEGAEEGRAREQEELELVGQMEVDNETAVEEDGEEGEDGVEVGEEGEEDEVDVKVDHTPF